jgi:hypothetical protein
LLATPTGDDGSIAPVVLVQRLEGYARSAAVPLPWDLEQALLRLPIEAAREIAATDPVVAGQPGTAFVADLGTGRLEVPVFEGFAVQHLGDTEKFGGYPKYVMPVPRIAPHFTAASEPGRSSPYTVLTTRVGNGRQFRQEFGDFQLRSDSCAGIRVHQAARLGGE